MKTETSPNWVQWVTLVLAVALLVGGFAAVKSVKNAIPEVPEIDVDAIVADVIAGVNIPTAEEIGATVNVDVPNLRNDNFDDILEGIYPDEVEDLEEDCQDDLWNEFGDDVRHDVQDKIEADIGEDIKQVSIQSWNWDNDYDFDVINLGLSDEDDREGEITTTLRVKYQEVFGDSDWHFAKVESTGVCSDWDKDNDEFDDLTVEYVVA